jgi:hypothetical protein
MAANRKQQKLSNPRTRKPKDEKAPEPTATEKLQALLDEMDDKVQMVPLTNKQLKFVEMVMERGQFQTPQLKRFGADVQEIAQNAIRAGVG